MTSTLDKQIERMHEYARTLGEEHGKNAASWIDIDETNAATILQGIEDCDPAVLDALPAPDLSGQWADDVNSESLIQAAAEDAGVPGGALGDVFDLWNTVPEAYELAFTQAMEHRVSETCRYYLKGER